LATVTVIGTGNMGQPISHVVSKGGNVVLSCRSGARAGQAEALLAGTGLANLHVLDVGITAWQNAGAPVNQGPARWDLERQVRLAAGALVLTGILASIVAPRAKWLSAAIGAGLTTAALTNTCAMGDLVSRLAAVHPRHLHRPAHRHRRAHRRPTRLTPALMRGKVHGRALRPAAQARPVPSAADPCRDRGSAAAPAPGIIAEDRLHRRTHHRHDRRLTVSTQEHPERRTSTTGILGSVAR
jgi:hypothetical protein